MWMSDDPVRDAERYMEECDRAYEAWRMNRPKCAICGEPIEDDMAVNIDDDWFCDDCLLEARRIVPEE